MRRACSSGHQGLLGQSGATSVMVACSRTTLARSLLISASGGKHQLFFLPSENRRPSAAMQFGSGFQLTYLCTCRLGGSRRDPPSVDPFLPVGHLEDRRIELEI